MGGDDGWAFEIFFIVFFRVSDKSRGWDGRE